MVWLAAGWAGWAAVWLLQACRHMLLAAPRRRPADMRHRPICGTGAAVGTETARALEPCCRVAMHTA
eukprot:COSAG01_NODE_175_length_22996_cov_18.857892_4_plen_67_part_00